MLQQIFSFCELKYTNIQILCDYKQHILLGEDENAMQCMTTPAVLYVDTVTQ